LAKAGRDLSSGSHADPSVPRAPFRLGQIPWFVPGRDGVRTELGGARVLVFPLSRCCSCKLLSRCAVTVFFPKNFRGLHLFFSSERLFSKTLGALVFPLAPIWLPLSLLLCFPPRRDSQDIGVVSALSTQRPLCGPSSAQLFKALSAPTSTVYRWY